MKDFKEFQVGWLILIVMISVQATNSYFYFTNIGGQSLSTNGFIAASILSILMLSLFYGLSTKVTSESITLSFGIGVIKKKIVIHRIESVEKIKSPWYYGHGIRFIPNGRLYNISGREGIELKFKGNKRVIRIGSKDASKLKDEIAKRIR
jgi:hypothetical protein